MLTVPAIYANRRMRELTIITDYIRKHFPEDIELLSDPSATVTRRLDAYRALLDPGDGA